MTLCPKCGEATIMVEWTEDFFGPEPMTAHAYCDNCDYKGKNVEAEDLTCAEVVEKSLREGA